MKLPKIGITTDLIYNTAVNFEGYQYSRVSIYYSQAILATGGIPFLIPLCNYPKEALVELVKTFDGLIFSGGQDVNPKLWGDEPLNHIKQMSNERDNFELQLFKIATELKKPILGICRGAQLMNVFFGGSLYQDIFTEAKAKLSHVQKLRYNEPIHKVNIKKDSIMHKAFGDEVWVNSYHHLAIKKLADKFKCTGQASDDIVEMFESKDEDFLLGVQWHPEMLRERDPKMQALFQTFLENC
ncbi:MAG: gamma-glutamyl-gamma-aminobutyrate hydrolase family protein [Treponemataceae bacterium]